MMTPQEFIAKMNRWKETKFDDENIWKRKANGDWKKNTDIAEAIRDAYLAIPIIEQLLEAPPVEDSSSDEEDIEVVDDELQERIETLEEELQLKNDKIEELKTNNDLKDAKIADLEAALEVETQEDDETVEVIPENNISVAPQVVGATEQTTIKLNEKLHYNTFKSQINLYQQKIGRFGHALRRNTTRQDRVDTIREFKHKDLMNQYRFWKLSQHQEWNLATFWRLRFFDSDDNTRLLVTDEEWNTDVPYQHHRNWYKPSLENWKHKATNKMEQYTDYGNSSTGKTKNIHLANITAYIVIDPDDDDYDYGHEDSHPVNTIDELEFDDYNVEYDTDKKNDPLLNRLKKELEWMNYDENFYPYELNLIT